MYNFFDEGKEFLDFRKKQCRAKRVNQKKTKDSGNIFFEALANRYRLISKLFRRIKEQQSFLWRTFYQMDFIKR